MSSYLIESKLGASRSIHLSAPIAQGAAGTIHRIVGEKGTVVKLYKDRQSLAEYSQKISAMLSSPPSLQQFTYQGQSFVQIAWPNARVLDASGAFCGFVMPEVDFGSSTELENILQRSSRQRKQLREFYGNRVLLAANLSALIAELHALGHYMVDMKPMNMRFYPNSSYMAILDTDGFSINGSRRFPARQFSDEYIAPEAKGKNPEQLGLEQDLFALATIVFRLLNNGIHPYQGVDAGNQPTSLQDRIFSGLYAYGQIKNRRVKPTPSSLHQYFEDRTRELFDRSFTSTGSRPSAAEWRDHLTDLIQGRLLVKCNANPKDHAHFSKGCGLCELERRIGRGARRPGLASNTQRKVQSSSRVLGAIPTALPHSPRSVQQSPSSSKVLVAVVLMACVGVYAYANRSNPTETAPSISKPAVTMKIPSAVLATALDAGKPKGITQTFSGKDPQINLYLEYRDARPHVDAVSVSMSNNATTKTVCTPTVVLFANGSYSCSWKVSDPGDYKVSIWSAGILLKDISFVALSDPPSSPPIVRQEAQTPAPQTSSGSLDPGKRLQVGEISAKVDSAPGKTSLKSTFVASVFHQNRLVLTMRAEGAMDTADIAIAKLDARATLPQVILTSFSGGAHCCTETQIATTDAKGAWRVVNAGSLDGGGYLLKDLDGDGAVELVGADNSFLYAFACYACSYAPKRILTLVGGQLRDVTKSPRFRSFLREDLAKMEALGKEEAPTNGFWAGWVAAKSIVGEVDEAWRQMIRSYDRQSDWPLEECLIPDTEVRNCPRHQVRRMDFPEALLRHLSRQGYITREQRARLAALSSLPMQITPSIEPSPVSPCFHPGDAGICN